jgi:hypothetical protein
VTREAILRWMPAVIATVRPWESVRSEADDLMEMAASRDYRKTRALMERRKQIRLSYGKPTHRRMVMAIVKVRDLAFGDYWADPLGVASMNIGQRGNLVSGEEWLRSQCETRPPEKFMRHVSP